MGVAFHFFFEVLVFVWSLFSQKPASDDCKSLQHHRRKLRKTGTYSKSPCITKTRGTHSSPVTPTSRKVRKHAVYGLFSLPENCGCPLPVHYCPEDAFCPQLVLISCIFFSLPSGSGGGVSFLEKSRTFAIASLARAFAS